MADKQYCSVVLNCHITVLNMVFVMTKLWEKVRTARLVKYTQEVIVYADVFIYSNSKKLICSLHSIYNKSTWVTKFAFQVKCILKQIHSLLTRPFCDYTLCNRACKFVSWILKITGCICLAQKCVHFETDQRSRSSGQFAHHPRQAPRLQKMVAVGKYVGLVFQLHIITKYKTSTLSTHVYI